MKDKNGMTLVELVVALLMSSILIMVLGSVIIAANTWWIRSRTRMESLDEMRYAQRRMEFLMRNAKHTFDLSKEHYTFEYPDNGDLLWFNDEKSSFKLNNGKLLYHSPAGDELLLPDVVRAETYILDTKHMERLNFRYKNTVVVTLVTEKDAPNGEIITSSTTFIVKSRNSGL